MLNRYRAEIGHQPIMTDNQLSVPDDEWEKMGREAKRKVYQQYGIDMDDPMGTKKEGA